MDRNVTKAAHRHVVALALIALFGPGCARMRTYRAQNSPLPGLPMLGRAKRNATQGPSALAARDRNQPGGNVAWSGQPNMSQPLARLDPPRGHTDDAPATAPKLAVAPPAQDVKPSGATARPQPVDPDLARIRKLVEAGRSRMAGTKTYQVAMNRQERVGETLQPAEDVLLSVRRDPKAIRLEWPSGSHKGREVLYSASEPGGVMHINMADSLLPVPKMTLPVDSPLVMKNSRHPITEAGLEAILDRLDDTLKPHEAGKANGERLTCDGPVTPAEVGRPCHKVTRVTGQGETWIIYLDTATSLPAFVQETAPNGDLLERYAFRDFTTDPPTLADASAFDHERRWGNSRGFFGRMAQGGSGTSNPR